MRYPKLTFFVRTAGVIGLSLCAVGLIFGARMVFLPEPGSHGVHSMVAGATFMAWSVGVGVAGLVFRDLGRIALDVGNSIRREARGRDSG